MERCAPRRHARAPSADPAGAPRSRTARSAGSWRRRGCGCRGGSRRPSASSRNSARSRSATRTRPRRGGCATAPPRSSSSHPVIVGSFVGIVVGARSSAGPARVRSRWPAGCCRRSQQRPAGFWAELVSAYRTTGLGGLARGEPRARGARRPVVAHAGQHRPGAEGAARRRPRARRDPDLPSGGPPDGPSGAVRARGGRLPAVRSDALGVLRGSPRPARRARDPARRLRADGDRVRRGRAAGRAMAVHRGPGRDDRRARGLPPRCAPRGRRARRACSSSRGSARFAGPRIDRARSRRARPCCCSRSCPPSSPGVAHALASQIGTTDLPQLARLAPGGGPGTWVVALFLPIAAFVSFALVGAELRGRAIRAMLVALIGLALSWLSAAGWVPAPLSNPLAYLAMAAVAEVMLVAYGVSSVVTGLGREAFGMRQILTGVLAIVLGGGLVLQIDRCARRADGPSAVPNRCRPHGRCSRAPRRATSACCGSGQRSNDPFPAPGGDPHGLAEAGDATLRYGLTGRDGTLAIDIGPTVGGPRARPAARGARRDPVGVDPPRRRPAGAVRGPVRDRGRRRSAARARRRCSTRRSTSTSCRRPGWSSTATLVPSHRPRCSRTTRRPSTRCGRRSPPTWSVRSLRRGSPLQQVQGGWEGGRGSGPVFLSTEFQGDWQLDGSRGRRRSPRSDGRPASTRRQAPVDVRYGAQLPATIQVWLLAAVWADGALGRPGSRWRDESPRAGAADRARRRASSPWGPSRSTRIGIREPAAAFEGTAASATWLCPHGGGEAYEGTVFLANPGENEVTARVTELDRRGRRRLLGGRRSRRVAGRGRGRRRRTGRRRRSSRRSVDGWRPDGWSAAPRARWASGPSRARRDARRTWFSAARDDRTRDEDAFLVVMNPFDTDAVFDVALFAADRAPVRDSELTDVTVRRAS